MARHIHELEEWNGRELLDASAKSIGVISGLGYPRRKFGTAWLLVDTVTGRRILVPADHVTSSGDRLTLPYPKAYVEEGPALQDERPLGKADERRLCLHYGFDSALPNSGCRQGCGFCQVNRRAKAARNRGS